MRIHGAGKLTIRMCVIHRRKSGRTMADRGLKDTGDSGKGQALEAGEALASPAASSSLPHDFLSSKGGSPIQSCEPSERLFDSTRSHASKLYFRFISKNDLGSSNLLFWLQSFSCRERMKTTSRFLFLFQSFESKFYPGRCLASLNHKAHWNHLTMKTQA